MKNKPKENPMCVVLDMPESLLKAKILILAWKEIAESFSSPESTLGHVYYRALMKIHLSLRKEALSELEVSDNYRDLVLLP